MTTSAKNRQGVFADSREGAAERKIVLTWKRTFRMCWSNVGNRIGRSFLTFLGIAVVAAFFMSSFSSQHVLEGLMDQSRLSDDSGAVLTAEEQEEVIHLKAVMEKAGVFTSDAESQRRQKEQRIWLLVLSTVVCLTGITNTILMSVTERFREIGTLKCLGALDSFIVRLFLVENLFLGILGSLIGVLFGYLLSLLQVGFMLEFGLLSPGLCFRALAWGGTISVLAGTALTVVAAVYPTFVAARMKPVDAMRTEV
jgi:predicted lysophospholipase L1 biosynthesis ABC-type transport system permease subunit